MHMQISATKARLNVVNGEVALYHFIIQWLTGPGMTNFFNNSKPYQSADKRLWLVLQLFRTT